jgi:hypothetical protein
MRMRTTGLLAALALLTSASQVLAAMVEVTFTGTVSDVNDGEHIFGSSPQSLVGESYVAQYVFNTSIGDVFSSPTLNYAKGGSDYGVPSPLISASATIGGTLVYTVSPTPNFNTIMGSSDGTTNWQYELAEYKFPVSGNSTENYIQSSVMSPVGSIPSLPISLTSSFSYTVVSPPDNAYSEIFFGVFNDQTNWFTNYSDLEASISQVSFQVVTPLPSTWIMMLAGLAGLGLIATRRPQFQTALVRAN